MYNYGAKLRNCVLYLKSSPIKAIHLTCLYLHLLNLVQPPLNCALAGKGMCTLTTELEREACGGIGLSFSGWHQHERESEKESKFYASPQFSFFHGC